MKVTSKSLVPNDKIQLWLEDTESDVVLKGQREDGFAFYILAINGLGLRRYGSITSLGLPVDDEGMIKDVAE